MLNFQGVSRILLTRRFWGVRWHKCVNAAPGIGTSKSYKTNGFDMVCKNKSSVSPCFFSVLLDAMTWIAPEIWWLEEYIPFGALVPFKGRAVKLQGGIICSCNRIGAYPDNQPYFPLSPTYTPED